MNTKRPGLKMMASFFVKKWKIASLIFINIALALLIKIC
jgi:hypothetical protein